MEYKTNIEQKETRLSGINNLQMTHVSDNTIHN